MSTLIKFSFYKGDTKELTTDENHVNFIWLEPETFIIFSVTQKGKAVSCHFYCDKKSLRKLKQAIFEFTHFMFYIFPWCRMIFGLVSLPSVKKLLPKCGYKILKSKDNLTLFWRVKEWEA